MLSNALKIITLIAWIGSMSWLIRYEAFPHWFDGTVQGYRELSQDLPALRDTWMMAVSQGKHVGYLNSSVEIEEQDGLEELLMVNQLVLQVSFQGTNETLRFTNTIRLNSRHELLESSSRVSIRGLIGLLSVRPTEEEELYDLKVSLNDFELARRIVIPDEAVMSSPLMDQGIRSVEPGQTLYIRTVDPFSMSGELQTIEVRGISSEVRSGPGLGEDVKVTRIETQIGEMVLESEVDEFGRVVWQKTPFGLTFMIGTPERAMRVPEGNSLDPTELFSASLLSNLVPGVGTQ